MVRGSGSSRPRSLVWKEVLQLIVSLCAGNIGHNLETVAVFISKSDSIDKTDFNGVQELACKVDSGLNRLAKSACLKGLVVATQKFSRYRKLTTTDPASYDVIKGMFPLLTQANKLFGGITCS